MRLGVHRLIKTTITLLILGAAKGRIDMSQVKKWKSSIFQIDNVKVIETLEDAEGEDWVYTDSQLARLTSHDEPTDFTLVLMNGPLEYNFYMRRVDEQVAVISFFDIAKEIQSYGFSLENYVIRNIYELVLIFGLCGKQFPPPPEIYKFTHHDIRGCLFDMNADKTDLVYSLHKPTICHSCEHRIRTAKIEQAYLETLKGELEKLRKSLFFRLSDFVKMHPVTALAASLAFAVLANLIANYVPGLISATADFLDFMLRGNQTKP